MKILVAMSGGIDSTVAALLLREAGHEVCGVTLRLLPDMGRPACSDRTCCSLEDAELAREAAAQMGFAHYVWDETELFRRTVIAPFAAGYLRGETPNPCLECNRHVKFSALWGRAKRLGFDAIATGHYARIVQDAATGRRAVARGESAEKDQSYVLYPLSQEVLAHLALPLGTLSKPEVRRRAAGFGLVNAEKPESQDICFVPSGHYADFVYAESGKAPIPGPIVSQDGRVLGQHRGLAHYTLGQRKGLGISASEPLYVCGLDTKTNRVVLGPKESLFTRTVFVRECVYQALGSIPEPLTLTARCRYHAPEAACTAFPETAGLVRVEFSEGQRAVTPGQALVAYRDGVLQFGGIIDHTVS